MSIVFPAWWEGGYPSVEVTAKALLDPLLEQLSPAPKVFSWLPGTDDNPTAWAKYLPFVLVMRTGLVKPDDLIDYARLDVACFGKSRDDSESLSSFVREMFGAHEHGCVVDLGAGQKARVTSIEMLAGQDVRPQTAFDKRATFATYSFGVRKNAGVPDYESLRQKGQLT